MEKNKVDMFLASNAKYFSSQNLMTIKGNLEKISDDKFILIQSINFKDPNTALILGILSFDRVYLGDIGLGIVKILLLFVLVGFVWWLIDLFSVTQRTYEYNISEFNKMLVLAS